MKITHIPKNILSASHGLIAPYLPDCTSTQELLNALRQYNPNASIQEESKPLQLRKIKDVSEQLQVTTRTVENLVARGELQKVHLGRAARITQESIDSLIQRQLEGGEP